MKTNASNDIDQYIAGFPPAVQKSLQKMRVIVREAAPDAEEAMKYRMPTFVLGENLVHFAAYEKHLGFYPTPSPIKAFNAALRKYESSKGAVQFPLADPLPLGLIKKMVRFRVKEVRRKLAARQKKKKR
jgi:uncharacterized protein YdhG (YjbR/CyaY superfamily)